MTVPLVVFYIAGWTVVFGTFAYIYHRRKSNAQPLESWFGPNAARDHYFDLLEANAEDVPLKAALLRRAMSAVQRWGRLSEEHSAIQSLVRSGAIGDDLWNQFQAAGKELDAEFGEIVAEAETFKEGWGQQILQQAADMVAHEAQKEQRAEAERIAAQEEKERKKREERERAEAPAREAAERARREKEAEKAAEELLRMEEKTRQQQVKQTAAGKKKEATNKKK